MKRSSDTSSISGESESQKKSSKLKRSDTMDVNELEIKSETKMDEEPSSAPKQSQDSQPVETYKTVGCGLHIGR